MFYFLSKYIWFFANPINLLIFLSLVCTALLFSRFYKKARAFLAFTVFVFAVLGFTPVGFAMLSSLENTYDVPVDLQRVDGVIVLGGGVDWLVSDGRGEIELSAAADRLTAAVALHNRFPSAKILYTGRNRFDEGGVVGSVTAHFESMGVSRSKIFVEGLSRNTDENARFSKEMMSPKTDEIWLLVTSAFHMKRSVLVFEKSNWEVIPYPVDFRSPRTSRRWPFFFDTITYLDNVGIALKEWIGIAAYRATGRA